MKKVLLGLAVAFSIASCAKDYSCECKVKHEQSASGYSETKEQTESFSMKGKEDDMKTACKDAGYNISYTDQAGYTQKVTSECSIK